MNRLWVRLFLYFALLVSIGVVLMVGLASALVSERVGVWLAPVQLRSAGGVVEKLADYYGEHGSWAGVDEFMRGVQAAMPYGAGRLDFTLTDEADQPVYRTRSGRSEMAPGRNNQPSTMIPIQVGERTVGALHVRSGAGPPHARPSQDFPAQLSRFVLLVAAVGGVAGIAFSVIASHNLTAPLGRLAAAARDIGARNFGHRVELSGSDEVREVGRAFNDMAAQLEAAETIRRNLVADVAHELRTPLSVLQGNLRAILDEVYPLEKAEIARLYTQTRLLSRLVTDLHELAQAEAGQLSLNRQPTDLAALIRDTADAHLPVAEEAGIALRVQVESDLPPIQVDAARMAQVLNNLLANALRHTPAGGQVTVAAALADGQIQLAVQDTGEGIDPEQLPYLFDRFYRADPSRARDTGGAGLGLTIVRAIVIAHGGAIRAESAGPDRGSRFTVTLPLN